MIINFLACMMTDDVQGEGGIPSRSHAGRAPQTKSISPTPQPKSLTSSQDVFSPNQWQAPAPPIQTIHRSDQDVQGSQRPPFSNTLIQQHADLLSGRNAPINIPSYQPAVVQCPHVEHGVLYYPPYGRSAPINIPSYQPAVVQCPHVDHSVLYHPPCVNIPRLERALSNVRLE